MTTGLYLTVWPVQATAGQLDAANPMIVLLRFLVGIVVVFLLIWFLARLYKRSSLGDYEGPGLRIVSRLPLSRSAQLVVVEIGGRMFLVGAGDSAVTPITEIYDTDDLELELQAATGSYETGGAMPRPKTMAQGNEKNSAALQRPFGQVLSQVAKLAPVQRSNQLRPSPQPQSDSTEPEETELLSAEEFVSRAQSATSPIAPTVTEDQMDAIAAQIAAEFENKGERP